MHAPLTHNFVQRYGRTEGDRMSESRRWGKESIYWSKYLYIVLVKLAKESRQSNNFSTNLGDVRISLFVCILWQASRKVRRREGGREEIVLSFHPSFTSRSLRFRLGAMPITSRPKTFALSLQYTAFLERGYSIVHGYCDLFHASGKL